MNIGAKQFSFCFAALLAAPTYAASLRAQVESTRVDTGEIEHQEILLDAERLRVNMTGKDTNRSFIFLTDGGHDRMVMLDKKRNEYSQVDQQTVNQVSDQMKGVMAQMQEKMKNMPPEQREMMEKMMKGKMGQMAGRGAAPVHTVYTAKGSGSVNGFSCTRYEGVRGTEKVADICAAKPSDLRFSPSDFQVFEKMKEFAASMQSAFTNMIGGGNYRPVGELGYEGFPIESTTYSEGKIETKSELKSIARSSLSDADFSVGNAKKVEVALPGAGKR
jgi:hypothetical protein